MAEARGLYGHMQRNFLVSRLLIGGFCAAVCVCWILCCIAVSIGIGSLYGRHANQSIFAGGGGVFVHSGGREVDVGPDATPECRRDYTKCRPVERRNPTAWDIASEGAWWGITSLHIPVLGFLAWLAVFWFMHADIVSWAAGTSPASRTNERRFHDIAENLSIAIGQPMPRLEVIETGAMNAFASGLSPDDSMIAVTRGLLNGLDDSELEAVVAHEYTHILNGDSCVMLVAAVFIGVFENAYGYIHSGITGAHEKDEVRWGLSIPARIIASLFIFVPLCVSIAACWVPSLVGRAMLSRSREFLADAGAVEMTKDPDALVSALLKIEHGNKVLAVPATMQAMMISGGWDGLLATHPPTSERISALRAYAGARMPVKRVRLASAATGRSGQQVPAFGRRTGKPGRSAPVLNERSSEK